MNERILIIEDDQQILKLLQRGLAYEGYTVDTATDGRMGLILARDHTPDLVILDWMLPKVSGVEICRRLRARPETRRTPILMLTARGEESDRVRGLDVGADDYLVKPFAMKELTARIRALLRRTRPELVDERLEYADIVLDRAAHRVTRSGRNVRLGPTEFRLLDVLMQRPGRVFSRERLMDAVWGPTTYVELRTVDVHVGRLRRALRQGGAADPIRTVRSAGYALDQQA
jgi:two-component system phosphate regulon response regulator PhoB